MRTIGKRWPRSALGQRQGVCSYCGMVWRTDKLVLDASGNWACPDDQRGRDVVTLAGLNADAAQEIGQREPEAIGAPAPKKETYIP